MKIITTENGYDVQVDDMYYAELSKYKWMADFFDNSDTYYVRKVGKLSGQNTRMHRVIMQIHHSDLNISNLCIDHIDHDGLNNQISNLRLATTAQNLKNKRKTTSDTSSIYKGVYLHRKSYQAAITSDGEYYYLGTFKTELEAALAYNKAAKLLHREFALLNNV